MSNSHRQHVPGRHVSRLGLWMLLGILLFAAFPVFGQQTYVTRFDVYAGYAYFNSPHVGLQENGFHLQAGVRPKSWFTLGFDYSRATGDLTLTSGLLTPAVQKTLTDKLTPYVLAGAIPANFSLAVPAHSVTQTFAGGPVLTIRHWKPVTLFMRPSLGAIVETATPTLAPVTLTSPVADQVVAGIVKSLAPTGDKHDRVVFYGFGGGIDLNFSKHVAWRVQADFVRDHLFDDLLKDARNTVRFSFGPVFNIGPNIVKD